MIVQRWPTPANSAAGMLSYEKSQWTPALSIPSQVNKLETKVQRKGNYQATSTLELLIRYDWHYDIAVDVWELKRS